MCPAVEGRIARLVASKVDVGRSEDFCQFPEHVAQEFIGEFIGGAEQFVRNAASCADGHLLGSASQFGIGVDGSHLVARHFDFGHHLHMVGGSVFHQFAHLVLRVESADGHQHIVHTHSR